MRVILFGATGMVGQGVLRECLLDDGVEEVLAIGRSACGVRHEKLREILHADFLDFSDIAEQLTGYGACFYCLGVASAGMKEEAYRRVTVGFTQAVLRTLEEQSPAISFIFVSGAGADSSGRSRTMWARAKGEAENAVLQANLRASYVLRPAFIQPMHGAKSRTPLYRTLYQITAPIFPLLMRLLPAYSTTTERMGRAMLWIARHGWTKRLLESRDIDQAGRASGEPAAAKPRS